MSKTWLTVDDVMDDLEEVTGRRVGPIDSRFAVTGKAPPPAYETDDDELIQMYGDYVSKDFQMEKPDLRGIQQMLSMVNNHYDHPSYDEDENIKELKKMANTTICISKLNPHVPEFVPKNISKNVFTSSSSSEKENVEPANGENSQTSLVFKESSCKSDDTSKGANKDCDETNKTETSHMTTKKYEIDVTKKIDTSNLNSEEINDMKQILKAKITDTSKADCLKKKRERNLAIASLLKLYTNIPKAATETKPLNLMTPDYFNTSKNDAAPLESIHENTADNLKSHIIADNLSKSSNNIKESCKSLDPMNTQCNVDYQQKVNAVSDSPTVSSSGHSNDKINDSVTEQISCTRHMSKEFKESIKKVDNWLNKPVKPKPKPSAFVFSSVTFKKKSKTVSVSPSLEGTEEADRPQSALASDTFVPSSYAEELSKRYLERSKARETWSEDMWTKLERELKERDKALLKQQEERS